MKICAFGILIVVVQSFPFLHLVHGFTAFFVTGGRFEVLNVV